MPYNTRRKSLSLPSLGIHVPMTQAARAAAAASRASSRASSSTSSAPSPLSAASESTEAHPSKRQKRSHRDGAIIEQTPPPSPPANSEDTTDADKPVTVDLEGINDDIVEAVIVQLQSTANRPHLVKELAIVLAQRLASVQHSANPCAIISSRLASYLKRTCWTALSPCPLAKELEAAHPRRTYYFLTTCPRLPFPESAPSTSQAFVTPSVSLTDDSGSDDDDTRRRELSPSPEVDLSPHQFEEDVDDNFVMPVTPIGSFSNQRPMLPRRISRHNSPPLEKDEREFTHTADILQKRKFTQETPVSESTDRSVFEYGHRDEIWFGDSRIFAPTSFITSPSIKPSGISNGISSITSSARKDDEAESWMRLNKLMEWDGGAESIEIDELDGLLDAC